MSGRLSSRWLWVFLACLLVGFVSLAIGAALPEIGTFWRSFLVSTAPSALVLAIVIFLIEGPILTHQRRRQIIIARNARSVLQLVGEISSSLARETAEWLAAQFDPAIDLYGDERADYCEFRPLLVTVYEQAKEVPLKGLPLFPDLTEGEYRRWLDHYRDFIERIKNRIQGDYEVQTVLFEVVMAIDDFERQVSYSLFPPTLRNRKQRYQRLGRLGLQLLDFDKSIGAVFREHPDLRPTAM